MTVHLLNDPDHAGQPFDVRFEWITPERARDLLTRNSCNRPPRDKVINAYVADMTAGNWLDTGDTVKISPDGRLLDGQHRLMAIGKCGIAIRLLVAYGVPPEAQKVVDIGPKRTLSDTLNMTHEKNGGMLAATLLRVYLWNLGMRGANSRWINPTRHQLLATLEENPGIRASIEVAATVRRDVRIRPAILALTHWLFVNIDADDCRVFFERLRDGAMLASDHPIAVLRMATFNAAASTRTRLTDEFATAYVIKSWNAYRAGRTITMLRYTKGGAHPETFPEPK